MDKESSLMDKLVNVPLHKFLGAEFGLSENGVGEVNLPVTENVLNASGAVHGAIYYFLCDIAASLAYSSLEKDLFYVTNDLNVSIIAAAYRGTLKARAQVLKAGKRLAFVECRITDEQGKLLAVGRVTKTILPQVTL